jgi:hypothetical protein
MCRFKYAFIALAFAATTGFSASASASVVYDISGTFQAPGTQYPDYAALNGGSFTGSFVAPDNTFPLSPQTYDELHDFQVNFYNSSGMLFSTLSGGVAGSYLQISNNNLNVYGGEQLTFVVNGTNYLQLIVPVSFNGRGDIVSGDDSSYAQAGTNYAYLATGNVAAVPEPSTWTMMILGFAGLGFLALGRKRGRHMALAA